MNDIKEYYDFVTEAWRFVRDTKAPDQNDNEAWDRIIDMSNGLCREFTAKMADWMEYLHDQSMKEGK